MPNPKAKHPGPSHRVYGGSLLPRPLALGWLYLLLGLAAAGLGGCAQLGPATLQTERNHYNIAVQRTNDEQLLLNLVRLKYRDTPLFMEVTSVASQFTLTGNASAAATLASESPGIFGFGAGASIAEKPTVTYSPLQGDRFIQSVLSPISLKNISLLYHSGWSVERIFRLCFQRLNGLKNAPGASGPTPSLAPDYEDFQKAVRLLRRLQTKDAIDLMYAEPGGVPALALEIHPDAQGETDAKAFAELVGVDPGKNHYLLISGRTAKPGQQIRIEPRSLLGILFYLSQAVEAPARDIESGRVTRTTHPGGETFDWTRLTGDLLRIASNPNRVEDAAVQVHYRGTWFYIDDTHLDSKSTFSLLAQLFSLQAGEVKSDGPVLTLPIGD